MTPYPVLDWCLNFLIIVATVSISLGTIIALLYLPSFFQKKIALKQAENIRQENLEIVERAIFFETSTELTGVVQDLIDDIRKKSAHKKSLEASIESLEKEKLRKETK